jgi:spore coat protein A, manganese oxidase
MRLSRRGALRLLGAGTVAAATPYLAGEALTGTQLTSDVPLPPPFRTPLSVPAAAVGTRGADGTLTYDLVQRAATAELLPGVRTPIWGYDGQFPGPTIHSRRGQLAVVRHRNELPVPTVTHLHGGHTPPDSDGYPTDLLLPVVGDRGAAAGPSPQEQGHQHGYADPAALLAAGTREYRYPMDQPAATLWYHDHVMDATAGNVWRGLAGFHLVSDDGEDALPLPRGDRDLPLMIMDRAFAADGGLHGGGLRGDHVAGTLGDVVLVNGVPWPVLEAVGARHRFRLLNASGARRYRLALDPPPPGGHGFVQIGSDGGLLAAPRVHDTITLAPAERCDVVVDLARYRPGSTVDLINELGSGPTRRVMRIRVGARTAGAPAVPARLATVEPLVPGPDARRRTFLFQAAPGGRGWTINGRQFDPTRTDADPRLGEIEVWRFVTDLQHPVHVHLAPFQVLRRGTGGPGPHDHGWKDTVDVRAAEAVTVAVRFTGYRGRYVLHCHNLEHEDRHMMATVRVH